MTDTEIECIASIGWAAWMYFLLTEDVETQCNATIEEAIARYNFTWRPPATRAPINVVDHVGYRYIAGYPTSQQPLLLVHSSLSGQPTLDCINEQ